VEPVSPELALVDPELARADLARAHLAPAAAVLPVADRGATGGAVETARPERRAWRDVAARVLLSVSLVANGILLASLAADEWRAYPVLAAPAAVPYPMVPPEPPPAGNVEAAAGTKLSALQPETSAAVEQKLLSALVAVCQGVPGSFLCTVRPARQKPREGLYARYRDGRFTWYPSRAG
jgi:hypothetical protein